MLDFKQLRGGVDGLRGSFEQLIKHLAELNPPSDASEFRPIAGAGGDGGVEAYWVCCDGSETGYQAKFHERASDIDWTALDGSVRTALATHPALSKLVVAMPCDLTDVRRQRGTSAREKWNARVADWNEEAKPRLVSFEFMGGTQIERLLTEPKALGIREYWFGDKLFSTEWFDHTFERTVAALDDRYHPEDHVDVRANQLFRALRGSREWRDGYRSIMTALVEALPEQRLESDGTDWRSDLASSIKRLAELAGKDLAPDTPFPCESWTNACDSARMALDAALTELNEAIDRLSRDGSAGMSAYRTRTLRDKLGDIGARLSELGDRLSSPYQMADQSRYAIIEGEAGSGKSHLMAVEVEAALKAGEPAVMLLGTDFLHGDEPGVQIARRFDLVGMTSERLLGALGAAAAARGTRALICIDALNEGGGTRYWRDRLAGFAAEVRRNPRLVLCVSCRDVYAERVFTPAARKGAAQIVIEGFETEEEQERAAIVYMDRRRITRPASPWLPPEFMNPLFLRTTCVALERKGQRQFPLGLRGAREMLRFYLEAAATTLDTQYDGTEELVAPLLKAVLDIAGSMAAARVDYIERRTAAKILNAAFESYEPPIERTWLELLRMRGLLRADPLDHGVSDEDDPLVEQEDVFRFAFQRIQDQLIAKRLTQDCAGPHGLFDDGGPVAFLIGKWGVEEDWRGVFLALAVEFADRWGSEIVDHMPGGQDRWWRDPIIQEAFIESVRWRQHASFGPRSLELLNRIDWPSTPIDLLIELSAVEGHPWNADMLHRNLIGRAMPERDVFWTRHINTQREHGGPPDRLIDWGLGSGPEMANSETVRLVLNTLGWLFTSTNGNLRDRATKSATEILMRHPGAVEAFVSGLAVSDDLYVLERVLASVAGACLRDPAPERLAQAASAIWRHVFSKDEVPVHVLLRDYGRLVMDLTEKHGTLPEGCDLLRCRPPYGSAAPRFGLDKAKVEAECAAVGDHSIFSSCAGFAGDFGDKIAKSRIREFSSIRLKRPRPIRFSEAYENFKTRWIIGDDRKETLLDILEMTAKKPRRLNDDPLVRSRAEARTLADAGLRRLLGIRATKAYENDAIPHLEGTDGWSGIGKELPLIDHMQGRLWIARRAIGLGWTSKRFPRDHGSGSDNTRATRTERIGKKYQWIAYQELLARLADNFWLAPEWDAAPAKVYDSPVDLPYLRDLEPTVRPYDDDSRLSGESLLSVPRITLDEVATDDMDAWTFADGVARERLSLGLCTDLGAESGAWLTLYRYASRKTDYPHDDGIRGAPFRLNDFHFVLMAAVKHSDVGDLVRKTRDRWTDFHSDWMMWGDLTDGPYLYEAGVRATWPDADWVEADEFRSPAITYLRFCREYRWEHHLDGTLPSGFSLQVPNPWLLRELELRADPNSPGIWRDLAGRPVIVSSSAEGNSYCLVRRDAIEPVLKKRGVTPLWVGVGERGAWPDPNQNSGPQRRWNGVLWMRGGQVKLDAWAEDFQPKTGLRQAKRRLYGPSSDDLSEGPGR